MQREHCDLVTIEILTGEIYNRKQTVLITVDRIRSALGQQDSLVLIGYVGLAVHCVGNLPTYAKGQTKVLTVFHLYPLPFFRMNDKRRTNIGYHHVVKYSHYASPHRHYIISDKTVK